MSTRLLYIVSHPIQYQAPLLRRIAAEPDIRLRVLFHRAETSFVDPGFGREVAWDVPLRDGYDNAVLGETELDSELRAADVVWLHGWQGPIQKRVLARARARGVPVLMRGENCEAAMPDGRGAKGLLKRLYLRRIFDRCAGFLTIGSDNHAYYLARGVTENRLFSMPYAVDNAFFAARAAEARAGRATLLADLGLPTDRPIVLYAGKLSVRKHPHTLLEAWRRAAWTGPRPLLVFAGDGALRPAIEAALDDADVRFLGFRNQTELPTLYALASVFVLASEQEPWGLAVNEAMACGTAVIVGRDCGCAADLVRGHDVGATVPAGDADALAAVLPGVVTRAAELGGNAAKRVASWDYEADVRGLRRALAAVAGGME